MEPNAQAKYFKGWQGFFKIVLIGFIITIVIMLISSVYRNYILKNPYEIVTIVLGLSAIVWYLIKKGKVKLT